MGRRAIVGTQRTRGCTPVIHVLRPLLFQRDRSGRVCNELDNFGCVGADGHGACMAGDDRDVKELFDPHSVACGEAAAQRYKTTSCTVEVPRARARGLFLGRVYRAQGRNYCTAHPLRGWRFFGICCPCPVDATVVTPLCCDRRH